MSETENEIITAKRMQAHLMYLISEIEKVEKTFAQGLFNARLAFPFIEKQCGNIVANTTESKLLLQKQVEFYKKVEGEYTTTPNASPQKAQQSMQAWIEYQNRQSKDN